MRPKWRSRAKSTAKHQIQKRLVRKSNSSDGIPEVDMSNEAIFSLIVSSWGLDLSVTQLPLVQDDGYISGEDFTDLLSGILYERDFF